MEEQQEQTNGTVTDAIRREASTIAERVSETLVGRRAVRGVTIDGPTSKDIDDAFWLERTSDGRSLLHISIVDIGSLITSLEAPEVEKEAFLRAFTRYYAESTLPMLPEVLSEGRLSLLEGQSCPTLTISLPLDAHLHVGTPLVEQTSLSNNKRFTYDEVDSEIETPLTEFGPMLQDAFRIAQGLLLLRRARGALAFYDLYTGWATTEDGVLFLLPDGRRKKAYIIIQEFMILANEALALYLAQKGLPALYRNHTAKATAPQRSALLDMLDTAVTHPELVNPERVSERVHLVMERATYAPTVEGHFGLDVPAYVHLTSPLRRYPDLVNQRILLAAIQGMSPPYTKMELETIAAHVNAEEATMKDAKKAHFLDEYDEPLRKVLQEAEEAQATTPRPLEHIDVKQFHSMLRFTSEGHLLPPAVEREIVTRLDEQRLRTNDIYAILFRSQNSGDEWERVKTAVLQWLQGNSHDAVQLLLMGYQAQKWEKPSYGLPARVGPPHAPLFTVEGKITVDGTEHVALGTGRTRAKAEQSAAMDLVEQLCKNSL